MAEKLGKGQISREFSGLPLKALLGAPLKATADANAMLARSQTQFMLSTCFEKKPDADGQERLSPKMIQFKLERAVINPDGSVAKVPAEMNFTIPLLTLVPLSSLAVDELDISFEMEVKSSTEHNFEKAEDREKSADGNDVTHPYRSDHFTCEMHGTIAKSSRSNQSEDGSRSATANARYDIKLHAGKLPLPVGLTTIIDIFSKNIAPIQLKEGANQAEEANEKNKEDEE